MEEGGGGGETHTEGEEEEVSGDSLGQQKAQRQKDCVREVLRERKIYIDKSDTVLRDDFLTCRSRVVSILLCSHRIKCPSVGFALPSFPLVKS